MWHIRMTPPPGRRRQMYLPGYQQLCVDSYLADCRCTLLLATLACLAGPRRRHADTTGIIMVRSMGMGNKMSAAVRTGRELKQLAFEKTHQRPGSGQRQYRLGLIERHLLLVEAISGQESLHPLKLLLFKQAAIDIVEEGGMHIRQPGNEPVG